ncbi:MAG: hypothetical protein ABI634_20115 [Acidobacteriota bacterium]
MRPATRLDAISLEPNPTVDAYKKDIDRTLLRENLKLTPEQRILKLQDFVRFLVTVQEAGRKATR